MSKKVLFENDAYKKTLAEDKWVGYELNQSASLTKVELDDLNLMLSMGVFTPVDGVSFWDNGDFFCDYLFTDEDREFRELKARHALPKWIEECLGVDELFARIAWVQSRKGHLISEGRWGFFILTAKNRLNEIKNAS